MVFGETTPLFEPCREYIRQALVDKLLARELDGRLCISRAFHGASLQTGKGTMLVTMDVSGG